MIEILNAQLADTFDMVSLIKQAHWNVKGAQFITLHQLYDEIAQSLLAYVDMIAERATALGGTALGTVRMAAVSSRLSPYPQELVQDMATVRFLADQMAQLAQTTRAAADRLKCCMTWAPMTCSSRSCVTWISGFGSWKRTYRCNCSGRLDMDDGFSSLCTCSMDREKYWLVFEFIV